MRINVAKLPEVLTARGQPGIPGGAEQNITSRREGRGDRKQHPTYTMIFKALDENGRS